MAEDLPEPSGAVRSGPGDEDAPPEDAILGAIGPAPGLRSRPPNLPGYRLRRAIEGSQRFRCDTPIGRIFHAGTSSYREMAPVNAVHITLDGNRISAHVDEVSPLTKDIRGRTHYSLARAFVHTFYALEGDLGRRLRRNNGGQRCNLDCEMVWVDDDAVVEFLCVKLNSEEAACPTCSDEKTFLPPAVGRE
ncbi:MAG: hypothetical protein ACRDZ8_21650 [Acidimicrobiales bacterium]